MPRFVVLLRGVNVGKGNRDQLLQGLRYVRVAVAALLQLGPQVLGLDAAIALALAPIAQMGVAQAAATSQVR